MSEENFLSLVQKFQERVIFTEQSSQQKNQFIMSQSPNGVTQLDKANRLSPQVTDSGLST